MRRVVILAAFIFVSLVYMMPIVITAPTFTQVSSGIEYQEQAQLAQEPQVVLTEHGSKTYLGGNQWRYRSSIGQRNTWNGEEYVPYIWNPDSHSVEYAGLTMEFYDWYIVLRNSTHTLIDDARWQLYYQNKQGEWRMLDLFSHSWLPAIINEENMTFGQSYTDGSNSMNITYLFRNCDEVKISAELLLEDDMTIQLRWQTTGILEAPEYIKNLETNFTEGVCFQDLNIMWDDAAEFNGINATFDYQAQDRKIDVLFSDIQVIANELYLLDPTYDLASDNEDAYADTNPWSLTTTSTSIAITNLKEGYLRFALSIPKDSTITTAYFYGYETLDFASGKTVYCYRQSGDDATTAPESLSAEPTIDESYYGSFTTNGAASHWTQVTITDVVQDQVNEAGWSSGNNMLLSIEGQSAGMLFNFEDYQSSSSHEAYLEVEYSAGASEQKTVSDTLNISSATIKGVCVVVSDTLGILSVSVFVFFKILTDILSLASTSFVIVEKLVTDTLNLSSIESHLIVFQKAVTDTLIISSVISKEIGKVIMDTLNISSVKSFLFKMVQVDTLIIASITTKEIQKSVSDILQIASSVDAVPIYGNGDKFKTVEDTLIFESSVSRPPNIFYELFLSSRMWGYIGPMALVIIGYIISKKEAIFGVLWFVVECLFIAHYLELVEATPQYWWHIIILLLGGLFTCIYPLWERRI